MYDHWKAVTMKIINKYSRNFFSSLLLSIVLIKLTTAQIREYGFQNSFSTYNDSVTSDERNTPTKNSTNLQSAPSPKPINHPCDELLNRTSESFGEFYKCSVRYARPYRFCEKCSRLYTNAISVYEEIQHSVSKK